MKWVKKWAYYGYSLLEIIFNFKNWPSILSLFLRTSPGGEHVVSLRQPPVRMMVRSKMDIWSVKETFLDGFYDRYGTQVQNGWIVIDIGAAIGDYSIHTAFGRPRTVIYAFEPYPESYQLLLKNLTLNAIDNVFAFQEAVWSQSGRLALNLIEEEPLKIASQSPSEMAETNDVMMVEAVTLEQVLERQALVKVDLLKLDCEGAEYEILMKAPAKTLAKIQRIVMEYHDVNEAHEHRHLIPFLESAGYRVSWHRNIVHQDIGYLYASRIR